VPNIFDLTVLSFVNRFADHSKAFDQLVVFIQTEPPLSGAVVMGLFWWAWGRASVSQFRSHERVQLVTGLVASAFSILVARVVAYTFPFRVRPLHNPSLHFQLPFGMNSSALIGWSSFPSDHAAFFFCLAAVLWMVSRSLGVVAGCVALFVVSAPRVYTGVHYPTDIIAGAVLGCGVAYISRLASRVPHVSRTILDWMDRNPAACYACLFCCTFEIGEIFTLGQDLIHPFAHVLIRAIAALAHSHSVVAGI
jgi:undecaprenyl-diphosphatase